MTEKQINAVKQIIRYADIKKKERDYWVWTLGHPLMKPDHEISMQEASAFIRKYIDEATSRYKAYMFDRKIASAARYKTMFDYYD